MTDTAGLMHILQICDSLFPVGAFTLSNGLETYVQHDIITSPKGLEEYLHSYISVLPYNELGAAAAAYNADEKELCRGKNHIHQNHVNNDCFCQSAENQNRYDDDNPFQR